jgi:hypothetical protein
MFAILVGIVILIYNTSSSASIIMSVAFKDKETSMAAATLVNVASHLFAGFIVNLNMVPVWLAQFQYLSFLKYGY